MWQYLPISARQLQVPVSIAQQCKDIAFISKVPFQPSNLTLVWVKQNSECMGLYWLQVRDHENNEPAFIY